jgi:hypothetical protein
VIRPDRRTFPSRPADGHQLEIGVDDVRILSRAAGRGPEGVASQRRPLVSTVPESTNTNSSAASV